MKKIDATAFYRNLGQLIVTARKERNLTQDQLADEIGLTRTSITNIERGRQKILLHTLFEIALALKVEPTNLLPPETKISNQFDRLDISKRQILLQAIPELVAGGSAHEG